MFHTVALLSPPYASLTYAQPDWLPGFSWQPGLRVAVPLGKSMLRAGVVLDAGHPQSGLPSGVKTRAMLWPLEKEPLLSQEHMELVCQLALRQLVSPGQILGTVLPMGLREPNLRLRVFDTGCAFDNTSGAGAIADTNDAVTVSHKGVTPGTKQGKPRLMLLRELLHSSERELAWLGAAWQAGEVALLAPREDSAATESCVLLKDPPWTVRPTAKRQIELLDYLLEHGGATRREVVRTLGQGVSAALDTLVKNGLVALRSTEILEDEPGEELLPPASAGAFTLSTAQQQALDLFCAALDAGQPASHLLFGVTGSGKTAVYLELAKACFSRGKSMLLLAPEVALALKLRRDARQAVAHIPLYFFHGYQSPKQREHTFRELAARNEPCLVVGTRSALFLPLPHLGAVVLDEEHDASFKQDEGLMYQAKEVAWFRVEKSRGLLVLGSATPDLKSFYAAREGRIPVSCLPGRVGGGTLPGIRLVDIRTADLSESLLVPESLTLLKDTVERGEQAVILLNRRGYAPLMYCLDCGKVARCPHCDIGLTYHKGRERLICHYCGYSLSFPTRCPSCQGLHYHPMGQGTERLEEHLSTVMPVGGKILRLDRDSTRCAGRMESILEDFAAQKAQVLVGTQMLSKGHHFPEVTLVIVADGDLGLNVPDYRAVERTFQLLVQSAGRAGRGEKAGTVLIQTRDTSHYCWKFIQTGDYESFYEHEIALRQRRRYPPFIRLALVRMNFPFGWAEGPKYMEAMALLLKEQGQLHNVMVLGPAPAPLPMLRGRKRFQCLLKAKDWPAVRAVYSALASGPSSPHIRLSLDMDPVSMM